MAHVWLVALVLLVQAAHVVMSQQVIRCDTPLRSDDDLHDMLEFESLSRSSLTQPVDIQYFPVVFHVFEDLPLGITVPDAAIEAQIAHANLAYGAKSLDTKIRFQLRRVDRYQDRGLAANCVDNSMRMAVFSTTLSDPDALHVFICNANTRGLVILGLARPPCQIDPLINTTFDGAIFINYQALPSVKGVYQGMAMYDEGDTFVHEMGHVFGLLHTFDSSSSCSGPGDTIDDTPLEQSPNYDGCNLKRNTCPSQPGYDPVQNYMDYSPDPCMDRFSPMQVARMHSEITRCLMGRVAPMTSTTVCSTNGHFGPAPVNSICQSKCSSARMPNGRLPPSGKKWCRTVDGKWGGNCQCQTLQVEPTARPSALETWSPTSSPFKATRAPTDIPTISPISAICSTLNATACQQSPSCRYLMVQGNLSTACKKNLGCRSNMTFCNGLCPKLCKAQTSCRLAAGNKCMAKAG